MFEVFGAIGVLAFFVGAIVWRLRQNRRARAGTRDAAVRVGSDADLDGDAAARRALDRTAWSRMYGP